MYVFTWYKISLIITISNLLILCPIMFPLPQQHTTVHFKANFVHAKCSFLFGHVQNGHAKKSIAEFKQLITLIYAVGLQD